MIASEIYKAPVTELKVIIPTSEPAMHAIPGHELLAKTPVVTDIKPAAKIFTISYQYQGEPCRTHAMQVGSGIDTFYKVVLCSKVSGQSNLCWLQKQEDKWSVLLGAGISNELLNAIAVAIETR